MDVLLPSKRRRIVAKEERGVKYPPTTLPN
jgi:hypothetical protein